MRTRKAPTIMRTSAIFSCRYVRRSAIMSIICITGAESRRGIILLTTTHRHCRPTGPLSQLQGVQQYKYVPLCSSAETHSKCKRENHVANFQNYFKHPQTFAFDTDINSYKQSGWNILLDWTPCNKKNTYKEERFQITHALSIHSYGLMDINATIQANKYLYTRNTNMFTSRL